LLSFEEERDKFARERKEFEAEQAAFAKQCEAETAALSSSVASGEHKDEVGSLGGSVFAFNVFRVVCCFVLFCF
jgi:hypothetical protein